MNMNLYVMFSLNDCKKQKNLFLNINIKIKVNFFSHTKLKINQDVEVKKPALICSMSMWTVLFCSMSIWTVLFKWTVLLNKNFSVFWMVRNKKCSVCNIKSDEDNYK